MKVHELRAGDMLDLENLALEGANGISAECELATIQGLSGTEDIHTDLVNLTVPMQLDLDPASTEGAWKFREPGLVKAWTW